MMMISAVDATTQFTFATIALTCGSVAVFRNGKRVIRNDLNTNWKNLSPFRADHSASTNTNSLTFLRLDACQTSADGTADIRQNQPQNSSCLASTKRLVTTRISVPATWFFNRQRLF